MNFLTSGEVIKKVHADRDRVSYALWKMAIAPIGKEAQVKVFRESALPIIQEVLKRKCNSFNNKVSK